MPEIMALGKEEEKNRLKLRVVKRLAATNTTKTATVAFVLGLLNCNWHLCQVSPNPAKKGRETLVKYMSLSRPI
jgi:hypothetical protein